MGKPRAFYRLMCALGGFNVSRCYWGVEIEQGAWKPWRSYVEDITTQHRSL